MGHDYQPYPVRRGDRFPADGPAQWGAATALVELPWSWTTDDYVYLEFVAFRRSIMPGLRRPAEMFDNFTGDVRWMTANVGHGVHTFVFHPQVIGRGHRLLAFEAWLDEIADLGLTFARLGDVAAAHVAGRRFGLEPPPAAARRVSACAAEPVCEPVSGGVEPSSQAVREDYLVRETP